MEFNQIFARSRFCCILHLSFSPVKGSSQISRCFISDGIYSFDTNFEPKFPRPTSRLQGKGCNELMLSSVCNYCVVRGLPDMMSAMVGGNLKVDVVREVALIL